MGRIYFLIERFFLFLITYFNSLKFLFTQNVFYDLNKSKFFKISVLNYKIFKNKFNFLKINNNFFFFDYLLVLILSKSFINFNYFNNRIFLNYKFSQLSLKNVNSVSSNFLSSKKDSIFFFLNSYISGLFYF